MQVAKGLKLEPEKTKQLELLLEKVRAGQSFSSLITSMRSYERSIDEIKAKAVNIVEATEVSGSYEGQKDFSGSYASKYWSVHEWDCCKRSENKYAYSSSGGKLVTSNENTANLFRLLDTLREKNPAWVVNTTSAGYKSGYRDSVVNMEVGGVSGSNHTMGCAADIHDSSSDRSAESLAEEIEAAAKANGLTNKIELGIYSGQGWCHIGVPGYRSVYYG